MKLVRDSYGCSAPLWADVIAAIPDRVEAAYLTAKTWAAEDRPGWAQQWGQPQPWRHGAGYLETCNGYAATPPGGTPITDPASVWQSHARYRVPACETGAPGERARLLGHSGNELC